MYRFRAHLLNRRNILGKGLYDSTVEAPASAPIPPSHLHKAQASCAVQRAPSFMARVPDTSQSPLSTQPRNPSPFGSLLDHGLFPQYVFSFPRFTGSPQRPIVSREMKRPTAGSSCQKLRVSKKRQNQDPVFAPYELSHSTITTSFVIIRTRPQEIPKSYLLPNTHCPT